MFFRKLAIAAKLETVYGTDAVPTGAANAMFAGNVDITPIEIEEAERDIYMPYLGNLPTIATAWFGTISFEIEVAGAGAAGTAPKYGPLLRACGLAEAISAGVSVTYTPVSSGFEAVSMYMWLDGVLHKFLGTRGSVAVDFQARAIPKWKFSFTGLFQPVADAAMPAVVYTGFVDPLAVNKVNTPTFTFHGYAAVMQALSIDLANDVKYRNLVNYEGVDNVDRAPKGTIEFESTLMATKNWFDIARLRTTGALNLIHGITAGNIVQVQSPAITLDKPKYRELDGIVMISGATTLKPVSGNDEVSFTIK